MRLSLLAAALAAALGCGSTAGPSETCGFVDEFLPYEVGYSWTYTVTDVFTGERRTKSQRIESAPDHPDYGPVVLQVTEKTTGSTHSLLRKENGRVVRFQQEDLDLVGIVERTTVYDPGRIRIDESADRITVGATFTEVYTETTTDVLLGERIAMVTDEWEVLGVDVSCSSPFGTFRCLEVRRLRTAGGNSDKRFLFAPEVGKVQEIGTNTLEDLVSCE